MMARHETAPDGMAGQMAARCREMVPEIATNRLVLRGVCADDFKTYAKIICGARGKFVGGPYDRTDAWFDFIQLASGWLLHGHGGWAIDWDQELCGFVILGLEPGDNEIELGFLVTQKFEGRSVAYEAASAVRNYADYDLKLPSLVSYIDPANTRSEALAKRLGAKRDIQAETHFSAPIHVWRYWGAEGALQ